MYKIQDGKIVEVQERELSIDDVDVKLNGLKDELAFKIADRDGLNATIARLEAEIASLEVVVVDAKAVGIEVTDIL